MQEFVSQYPALVVAGSLVVFAAWWVFLSYLISWASGWHALAKRYRTERELPERRRRMQSAQMRRLVGYNNALTLGSDGEGIYVAMTIPIFAGHPRLFIPWPDVRDGVPTRRLWLTVRSFAFGPDGIPLRVRESLAQFLLEPRSADRSISEPSGSVSRPDGMKWGIYFVIARARVE